MRIPVQFEFTCKLLHTDNENEFYIYSDLPDTEETIAVKLNKNIWDIAKNLSSESIKLTRESLKENVSLCHERKYDKGRFFLYLDKGGAFDLAD